MTHVFSPPANTAATPDRTDDPGVVLSVVRLCPSWPLKPLPQQYTLPDERAHVCDKPVANALAPVSTVPEGVDTESVVPTPHWPLELAPQHRTPLVDSIRTHVKCSPADTADAALPRAKDAPGEVRAVNVPSPS
jgi:hypothetical protein